MYAAGRALQFLGLIVTGIGFFQGVARGDVRRELVLLALGAAIFFTGWLLQRRRR